jgi:hypothetical protein
MVRNLLCVSTAAALANAIVSLAGTGVAVAAGRPPAPTAAAGTTTCNFHGTLTVTDSGTVSMRGNLAPHRAPACSNKGGRKFKTGHLSGLASTATIGGICNLLIGGSLPPLSGGIIAWSPQRTAATSRGIALTGGTISTLVGTDSPLHVGYTGGSVASGSFTNSSGASLNATSQQTTAELTVLCAIGPVHSIAISGTLTL